MTAMGIELHFSEAINAQNRPLVIIEIEPLSVKFKRSK